MATHEPFFQLAGDAKHESNIDWKGVRADGARAPAFPGGWLMDSRLGTMTSPRCIGAGEPRLNHSSSSHSGVGLVCPGPNDYWLGGVYYLHHLLRCLASLPPTEGLAVRDVWWGRQPASDPFADVRSLLGEPATLTVPRQPWARIRRRVRRLTLGYREATLADLFHEAGIGLLFPSPPCANCGIPLVSWITDFQYRHLPQLYTEEAWRSVEEDNRRIGEQSTLIMLSSQDACKDIRSFFPEFAHKARVVSPCSVPTADWWQNDPSETAGRYELPERFFLISNQVCAHKNHRTVCEALKILQGRGVVVPVVCTGRAEDYRNSTFFPELQSWIEAQGLGSQIRFLGAVPRADYIALIRRSLAVLQPSTFEGWGFALADAKALGKPVLASDLAVHHEHHGPVREYLPPLDAEAWAGAIGRAYVDLAPGPDTAAEERAREGIEGESRQVGRALVALFREAMKPGNGTVPTR